MKAQILLNLDVVVPTYNRSDLLRLTLASLLAATVPAELNITIYVVDNNSIDDTGAVVKEMQDDAKLRIVYVKEIRPGSSRSRNAGIAAGTAEIIGFIDDDEQVDEHWFQVIAEEFQNKDTDFIGGPYLANCAFPMPPWLPPGYHGVIGVMPPRARTRMTREFSGNLQGGNAVIRRAVFDQLGLYNVNLGRSGKGLLSEEDAEFYRRILAAGLCGYHVPTLIIYHHIPASRLTKKYHRSWCYWRGVSHGIADKQNKELVTYLLGVPRYRIKKATLGLLLMPRSLVLHSSGPDFARELALWDLLGFIRGKYSVMLNSLYTADSAK
jgi:glycosyltransferase involved in cell wall biosynthesis